MATKWHCVPGKHNTVPLKQNGLHLAKTEDQIQRGINFTISHPTPFLPILPSGNLFSVPSDVLHHWGLQRRCAAPNKHFYQIAEKLQSLFDVVLSGRPTLGAGRVSCRDGTTAL